MTRIARLLLAASLAAALTACTANSTGAPPISSVNPGNPSYSKLQFAVGTANVYGTPSGLNIVSTLRQPNGYSATGVNSPSITGPFTFAVAPVPANGGSANNGSFPDLYATYINGGPSLSETSGTPAITSTSQLVHIQSPFCDTTNPVPGFTTCPAGISPNASTFGQSGGVFAMGIAPYNHASNTGQAYGYAPYPQPFYDTGGRLFLPWGGPPAFDPNNDGMGMRDGLSPTTGTDSMGQPFPLGVAEGVTIFDHVTARAGQYALAVQIGTIGNNGAPSFTTLTANATLNPSIVLPTVTAPLVTPAGDGSASFSVVLPAPVSEGYVQIVDYGPGGGVVGGTPTIAANCQGPKGTSFAPVYYTIHVTASGSYTLGKLNGPNTNVTGGINNLTPSPSICTGAQNLAAGATTTAIGDNFTVQLLGFDYPIYQAAFGLTQATTPQSPPIVGSAGQSDVTVSVPNEEDFPGYAAAPVPVSKIRRVR